MLKLSIGNYKKTFIKPLGETIFLCHNNFHWKNVEKLLPKSFTTSNTNVTCRILYIFAIDFVINYSYTIWQQLWEWKWETRFCTTRVLSAKAISIRIILHTKNLFGSTMLCCLKLYLCDKSATENWNCENNNNNIKASSLSSFSFWTPSQLDQKS